MAKKEGKDKERKGRMEEARGFHAKSQLSREKERSEVMSGKIALNKGFGARPDEPCEVAVESEKIEDAPYEGGLAVASPAEKLKQLSLRGLATGGMPYKASEQSSPVAAEPIAVATGSNDLGTGHFVSGDHQPLECHGGKKVFGNTCIDGLPLL